MPRRKPTVTPELLYELVSITDCQLSPDGEHLVYTAQRVDRKSEKKFSDLWVAPTRGGAPRQYTYGDHVDTRPRWSPDGEQIVFLSNRADEKQNQLYLLPFRGGEARRLTDMKGTFQHVAWSPDGRQLLVQFVKKDAAAVARDEDETRRKLGVVDRRITRVAYKLDGAGFLPEEQAHIWTVDARRGRPRQLTDHPVYAETDPSWSPDGRQIIFTSVRVDEPDFHLDEVGLYTVPAEGGDLHEIPTGHQGRKLLPVYSPDGQWIAYLGRRQERRWWQNMSLYVVPAGGGQARNLTTAHDLHCVSVTNSDVGGALFSPPVWAPDSRRLYFVVTRQGRQAIMAVTLEGELEPVVDEPAVTGAFSLDAAGQRLAYFQARMADPGQLFSLDLKRSRRRQLTRLNRPVRRLALGQLDEHWIDGPDGHPLHGWILHPPDFDPARRYPAILEIHGGPQTQYGQIFPHELYYLAACGYVVGFCNPRGSQGYGEAHSGAIYGCWGTHDLADLLAWADLLAGLPYVDAERMGVTGGSYGGYMTTLLNGHTDRFKAAVAQRVVSNWISFHGSADFNYGGGELFGVQEAPWENVAKYWQDSPLSRIGNARTPMLVIHSENDYRCNLEQGEQVYVALKRLGVPTELVLFPGESHGLSRTGRTDRRIARLQHIRRWFDRYLMEGG